MTYIDEISQISLPQLHGFFVGWRNPLSPEMHYELLRGSTHFVAAMDDKRVVGFVTALSDGVNSAFIPLLEVLPEYQKRGIGTKLFTRILDKLADIPNVDLMCDAEIQPFYERFKMTRSCGMIIRKGM